MHRRTPLLLSVCLAATAVVVLAPAARAARPFSIQQFMPNDTQNTGICANPTPPGCTPDALSDKFDGVDSLAHLTVVTSQDAERVLWYVCPLGMPNAPADADLATCNVPIGTDTTGVSPPGDPDEEAYDVNWNIDGSLDQQRRDIVALACIGTGEVLNNPTPNCRAAVEHSIFLEDAQTGAALNQTSAAEFGRYRTLQPCLGTTSGNSACDAAKKLFPHGSSVPNDGFDFIAFTSDDVDALQWELNEADADQEPAASNFSDFGNCSLDGSGAISTTFKRWLCVLNGANIPADSELALSLLDANASGAQPEGTAGYCNSENNPTSSPSAQNIVQGAHDTCVLDVHYIVSVPREATRVVQTFAPNPPSPSANASCTNPDVDESSRLGTTEDEIICLFDQFGDPFNGPWTEETSGQGQIQDCGPEGVPHDHNGDGTIDDCHGATGADGQSSGITLANPAGSTGDQVLTSCFDLQNSTANPPVANHGCADATGALKTTKTIHWTTLPTDVFLAFNDPAPSNAADPCRTGVTFKHNVVGDHDILTFCTFDSNGNPVSTQGTGYTLQWTITGAHGQEQTAVRFNPAPPPNGTGSNAQGTAEVDAVHEGDNFIQVCLLDPNGDVVDCFSIEKQVDAAPGVRNVPTNLTAKKGRKFIRGKAKSAESECQSGRHVTLFRRRKGPDDVVGSDSTNQFGRWGVKTGHRRGTYYARVAASQATDRNGEQLNCLGDQSKDIHRP